MMEKDDMELIDVSSSHPLWAEVWNLYLGSFPAPEIRTAGAHERATGDAEFHPKIAVDSAGQLLGLLFYWEHDGCVYIEHLAVNPARRGQRIGSRILEHFLAEHAASRIVLEIDPPQDELSLRRLRFYARLGFVANDYPYLHPSFRTGDAARPHRLVLLSYGTPLSEAEYGMLTEYVRERVLRYVD